MGSAGTSRTLSPPPGLGGKVRQSALPREKRLGDPALFLKHMGLGTLAALSPVPSVWLYGRYILEFRLELKI